MRRLFLGLAAALALAACHPKPAATADAAKGDPKAQAAADAFMIQAAKEPGVKVLPSGLIIKVVHSGPATGQRPQAGDDIKINYEGKLASNGHVFDSTYERGQPAAFPLRNLIPAWIEAVPLMRPGDEWILYVPPKLGYREAGAGGGEIPPNAALIFRIELIDFLPAPGRVQNG
jgi:peptidylprolyl isomerase/FKBP-type peptidyl-prolyl cis-trans isomerase FklB